MKRRHASVRRPYAIAPFVLVLAACTASGQHRTTLVRRERTLASLPFDPKDALSSSLVVSPDGTRGAYLKRVRGLRDRLAVVIDGNEETQAYEQVGRNFVTFSPDSRSSAYAAMRDGTWYVVLNGAEGEPFEAVIGDSITFSPDGKRLAYVARRDGNSFVVAEGIAGPGYDGIAAGSLTFGPDGRRLAYAARRGDAEFVVADGVERKAYDAVGRPYFSTDGRRLAHAAHAGGRSFLVADGNEILTLDGGDAVHDLGIVFSRDGSRIACVVGPDGQMRAVVDGAEGKPYAQVFDGSIAFSPDGRRVAYMATRAAKGPAAVAVIDGQEGKPHDGVVPGTIRFSPDGRRVAYVAEKLDVDGAVRRCAVVDGVEGPPYDWLRHAPVFSPDGRHVAYVAERRVPATRAGIALPAPPSEVVGFESVVVVDGTEAGPYPWVRGDLLFTPDGSRVAYVAAAADDRFADAGEIPADPANPSAGGRLVFDKVPRALVPTGFRSNQPDPANRPLRLLVVEEQIGTE